MLNSRKYAKEGITLTKLVVGTLGVLQEDGITARSYLTALDRTINEMLERAEPGEESNTFQRMRVLRSLRNDVAALALLDEDSELIRSVSDTFDMVLDLDEDDDDLLDDEPDTPEVEASTENDE